MPYKKIKLPNKNKYKVVNKKTGEIKAKNTTKQKADNQIRLLNYVESKSLKKK
jgi:hypothetical protein